jgi:hypothetical protein
MRRRAAACGALAACCGVAGARTASSMAALADWRSSVPLRPADTSAEAMRRTVALPPAALSSVAHGCCASSSAPL